MRKTLKFAGGIEFASGMLLFETSIQPTQTVLNVDFFCFHSPLIPHQGRQTDTIDLIFTQGEDLVDCVSEENYGQFSGKAVAPCYADSGFCLGSDSRTACCWQPPHQFRAGSVQVGSGGNPIHAVSACASQVMAGLLWSEALS